jgi:uncharacterized repeat protein (TIGR01451 family)
MVEKTDSVDSVYAETPYDYSISVSNGGPSPATGVMVTDVLSTGLTFVSSDICSYDTSSRTVSCPLGEVSVLATEFVTFTVLAPPDGSLIFNVASVSANEAELNPGDNSASEETLVVPHADLSLSKSAPPTVYRDSLFEYTLTASNLGPSIAENVILTDALPGNVAYEYSVNAYGSCSHNSDNHTVTCTLGEIPAGSSREIKIIVTPTIDGPLLNTATITSNTDDLVPGNNGASATSNAVIDVNLSVEKTYSPEAVAHGDSFSYAIVVRNSGLSDATAVNVVDTLPDGVAFDSLFAPPGWSCSYNGSTEQVSCQPDSGIFSSGNQATINIEVTATEPGQPTNSAILSAAEGSDSDSVTTDVDPKLDLSVELGGPISVTLGSPYSYTLTVANSGPSSATNVRLASELDPDVSFVDVEALSGNGWLCSYEASQHRIGCSNSTLPAGAQANFVITVRPENDSLLLNQGEVSANESGFDTNSGNDYDSFVTDVD